MTPWKSLAPWLLLLVQEPYLCINLYYKNLGFKICTTRRKNHMQTTLDTIIGENQSTGIKSRTILHTFITIWDVVNVSAWDFMPIVSLFCHKMFIGKFILAFSNLAMEPNSFTRLKLGSSISNLKIKKMVSRLNLLPLYVEFAWSVHSHTGLYYRDWGICHLYWCWHKD